MPLDDDYKDYLKSAFADIPNIGGRWGGAITAAMFLKEFAGRHALGAPRHRRHRLARRRQAVPGQRPDRRGRPYFRAFSRDLGLESRAVRREPTPTAALDSRSGLTRSHAPSKGVYRKSCMPGFASAKMPKRITES